MLQVGAQPPRASAASSARTGHSSCAALASSRSRSSSQAPRKPVAPVTRMARGGPARRARRAPHRCRAAARLASPGPARAQRRPAGRPRRATGRRCWARKTGRQRHVDREGACPAGIPVAGSAGIAAHAEEFIVRAQACAPAALPHGQHALFRVGRRRDDAALPARAAPAWGRQARRSILPLPVRAAPAGVRRWPAAWRRAGVPPGPRASGPVTPGPTKCHQALVAGRHFQHGGAAACTPSQASSALSTSPSSAHAAQLGWSRRPKNRLPSLFQRARSPLRYMRPCACPQ
jgi:hypothetical protein